MRRYEDPSHAAAAPASRPSPAPTDTAVERRRGRSWPWSPGAVARLQRLAGNAAVSRLAEGEATDATPRARDRRSGRWTATRARLQADMEGRLGGQLRRRPDPHRRRRPRPRRRAVDAKPTPWTTRSCSTKAQYHPSTAAGRRTIAHELTHVIQQRSGPVDGTPAEGGDPRRATRPTTSSRRRSATPERAVSAAPEAGTVGAPGAVLGRHRIRRSSATTRPRTIMTTRTRTCRRSPPDASMRRRKPRTQTRTLRGCRHGRGGGTRRTPTRRAGARACGTRPRCPG